MIALEVGQELDWREEAQRLCVYPQLIPSWQAGVEFTMGGGGLSTAFKQNLLSAEPAVIEEAFNAFRVANEAAPEIAPAASGDTGCAEAPPSYQPAPLGDDAAVAWEATGGPNSNDRSIVIRSGDVLMMIWLERKVLVPEGAALTREQIDAVAATAVNRLP